VVFPVSGFPRCVIVALYLFIVLILFLLHKEGKRIETCEL